jgi:hypothetical protein
VQWRSSFGILSAIVGSASNDPPTNSSAGSASQHPTAAKSVGNDVGAGFGGGPYKPELKAELRRNRELGYRLQRQAWGRGFATERSRALIESAFKKLGTNRIWAQTMTVNTASRRVLERCGLHYVRTFNAERPERIEGSEFGDVEYEILKAEWEALSAFREEWTENRKPGPRSV